MTENEIKGALMTVGLNQRRIAEKAGVTPVTVLSVVKRKGKSHRVAQIIADEIGRPLLDVFPEYKNARRQYGS